MLGCAIKATGAGKAPATHTKLVQGGSYVGHDPRTYIAVVQLLRKLLVDSALGS
jgi:hypothetical protein